jgi:hypothetical protein
MDKSEREHAELMLLYEQASQDLRAFQDRQTLVTNLTVLVYAALIAIAPNVPATGSLRGVPSLRSELSVVAGVRRESVWRG